MTIKVTIYPLNGTEKLTPKVLAEDFHCRVLDGALSELFTPAPMKEYLTNKMEDANGKEVFTGCHFVDERELNLPVAILADNFAQYMRNKEALLNHLMSSALHYIEVELDNETYVFKLSYLSVSEFVAFNGRWGKMTLKFNEPNPADRV